LQGPTENRQGEWAPWLNIIIIIIIIIYKTKKAPKPCDTLQRFLPKAEWKRFPLQDKRRSKEHNFGIIPLISSAKVWFMDNGGLKIVFNIV